ncbi:MAG: hypothetical protein DCF25_02305 [Leptolyngbya foveolarum]|uniref:Uncharacterized protein n=1 Tax=Leptolyngbya foveolarum TaxID=47253 RepID=A0A2W4WJR3_9CYAN|nr:MAG: hypothetical protein DCF25_02305 [Leptolyngbya foveolarum]
MPRRISKKCVECARLSAPVAQQLHGPEGDGCWVESRCRRRRSHYRNRLEVNEKRRSAYREVEDAPAQRVVEEVSLAIAEDMTPYATLYIWREKRKDAPVHAISASVFQGSSKVLEIKPIHCAGLRKRSLEKYVQKDVMGYLKARFGITFFANEVRLEPIECSIQGCSLKVEEDASLEQIDLLGGGHGG